LRFFKKNPGEKPWQNKVGGRNRWKWRKGVPVNQTYLEIGAGIKK